MNNVNCWVGRAKIASGIALLVTLMGCVGYVGPDGGTVVVPGPEVDFYGGGVYHDHVRDVHVYSHRGEESRGVAHGGGGFRGGRH